MFFDSKEQTKLVDDGDDNYIVEKGMVTFKICLQLDVTLMKDNNEQSIILFIYKSFICV